jgi:hypothetical protein
MCSPETRECFFETPEYATEVTAVLSEEDLPLSVLYPDDAISAGRFADMTMLQWSSLTSEDKHAAVATRAATPSKHFIDKVVAAFDRATRKELAMWKEMATCTLHDIVENGLGPQCSNAAMYAKIDRSVGDLSVLEWERLTPSEQKAAVGGLQKALFTRVAIGENIFESAFL